MLTWGSKRNRSTPSNLWPSTSAAAVRSSMVSSPIGGSLSSPLPTTPGQAALCSLGKLFAMITHKEIEPPRHKEHEEEVTFGLFALCCCRYLSASPSFGRFLYVSGPK